MKKDFGITQKGEYASLYTLSNKKGMKIAVSDYGATPVSYTHLTLPTIA